MKKFFEKIQDVSDFQHLPKDSVFEEFCTLLTQAKKPSIGFEFLRTSGWIIHFPELNNLIACPQNPVWHPEGDVWIHTMMVIDNAAILKNKVPEELQLAYMFGALLHDIGKPATTVLPECTAHGHAEHGSKLAIEFMSRLTDDKILINQVESLVKFHMHPGQLFRSEAKESSWKRLHKKCRLDVMACLHKADSAGRTGVDLNDTNKASEKCLEYFALFGKTEIKAIVQGRDLIAIGLKPGRHFDKILKQAYELQIGGMNDVDEILQAMELK